VLVVVLMGGFVINGGWCLVLNFRNSTAGDYVKAGSPVGSNLFFASLAGLLWCLQFVCFKTGEPSMGKTSYIGWAVLMAASILFSQLLGIMLGEWKGTGAKTRGLLAAGLLLLIASSALAGYAGSL
jgi:L-rhamnose-H+ transport protein